MEQIEDEHGNLTTVYTTANIEDIQVGDLVYSYNTQTGETELAEVTATFALTSDHINYLTIIDENGDEQVIETTDAHPFWVVTDDPDLDRAARSIVDENGVWLYHENISPTENGFWVEAKDLRVGDVFLGANGELSTLTSIVRVEQSGGIAVFNFTVEGNHNYFILAKEYEYGQTCVLVHNAQGYFPNDPNDLLPELPRNPKGQIFPNSNTRIRPEQHPMLPGETYTPRHHDLHYHIEVRNDPTKSFNNANNTTKIKPPGYVKGDGTGFLPDEPFPI